MSEMRLLDVRRALRGRTAAQGARLRPGLAHRRLTPSNNDDLLFDDVMWVENAQRDHADFVEQADPARRRGGGAARRCWRRRWQIAERASWLLDRKIVPNQVGLGLVEGTRAYLESLPRASWRSTSSVAWPSTTCPRTSARLPRAGRESTGAREYLMPPLPNTLYTRDTTCWLYGGLTLNPLYWPARQDETLIQGDVPVPPGLRRLDGVVGRPRASGARRPSRAATSCRSATAWC